MIMTESQALQRILAYIAETRMIAALEAEVKYMATKANDQVLPSAGPGKDFDPEPPDIGPGKDFDPEPPDISTKGMQE